MFSIFLQLSNSLTSCQFPWQQSLSLVLQPSISLTSCQFPWQLSLSLVLQPSFSLTHILSVSMTIEFMQWSLGFFCSPSHSQPWSVSLRHVFMQCFICQSHLHLTHICLRNVLPIPSTVHFILLVSMISVIFCLSLNSLYHPYPLWVFMTIVFM